MNIKYYFLEPKKEKSSLVISVAWKGIRVQSSIGLSGKTSNFDVNLQKFKKNTTNSAELNNYLNSLSQELNDFYFNSIATNKVLLKEDVKNKINSYVKISENIQKKRDVNSLTVLDIVESFFENIKCNPLYQKMTIKKYKTFYNNIRKYIDKNYNPEFKNINYQYVLNFALFLSNELNLADATIHKTLKMLTVTLNKAFDDGLVDTQFYKPIFKKLFKDLKLKPQSRKFSLTKEEVLKIENYKPSDVDIQLTKDMFLFEIYTLLRISDLSQASESTVNLNERTLNFRQQKTGELASIPLIDKAMEILKKYPRMKFPKISHQYYNRQIKVLAKEAGIDDLIQIERKSLNNTEQIVKKKWELIASHHARVTGIVNMAQHGALPEEIISVSGHSNPRSIEPYMKIAADEKKKRSRIALEKAFG